MTKFIFFIFLTGSYLFAQVAEEPPLYFWDARLIHGFSNFGDALSEALTERIIGHEIRVVKNPFCGEKKLLGMGSILNYATDGDIIWGTGRNGTKALEVSSI